MFVCLREDEAGKVCARACVPVHACVLMHAYLSIWEAFHARVKMNIGMITS